MNKQEIKDNIKKNIQNFPLSFYDLKYKDKNNAKTTSIYKIVKSEKYYTNNFPVYKFYKPITQF